MNKIKLSLLVSLVSSVFYSQAQTAVNFTCADCNNQMHDLFTELDQGKVVVITWVMPCPGCVDGSTNVGTYVQALNSPNVVHYVVDDYGNTACQVLSGWIATNSVFANAYFSDSTIAMAPYGVAGMPKVVILSGINHQVYYNENNTFVYSDFQAALNAAIQGASVPQVSNREIKLFPNPASTQLSIGLPTETGNLVITDIEGRVVHAQSTKNFMEKVSVEQLPNGMYTLAFTTLQTKFQTRFVVAH